MDTQVKIIVTLRIGKEVKTVNVCHNVPSDKGITYVHIDIDNNPDNKKSPK